MTKDGLRTDYIANSSAVFTKTIVVKLSPSKNIPKELNNKRRTININTDSGKYLFGIPIISFKAWNNGYIGKETRIRTIGHWEPFHYRHKLEDSILYLSPIWYSRSTYPLRRGRPEPGFVTFFMPEGTKIYISPEIRDLLSGDAYRVNSTWQITNKGFKEIEKK
jgi:hypothetical protein